MKGARPCGKRDSPAPEEARSALELDLEVFLARGRQLLTLSSSRECVSVLEQIASPESAGRTKSHLLAATGMAPWNIRKTEAVYSEEAVFHTE